MQVKGDLAAAAAQLFMVLLQKMATREQHCFMSNSGSSGKLSLWDSWLPELRIRVELA